MNLDNNDDESIEKNDVKLVETLTKKSWFKSEKFFLVWVIDKNQFICHSVHFNCQFQDFNSKQFSEKTTIKEEVSHSVISDFNFKDLNSNCLKMTLCLFFKSELKKITEDSASSFNQIIKTSKNLKYMTFSKTVNADNTKKLQVAVKKCESILNILNKHIQILNIRKEFRWS